MGKYGVNLFMCNSICTIGILLVLVFCILRLVSDQGDVEDDPDSTTTDAAHTTDNDITTNDITRPPGGQAQPVFRRVIYDSSDEEDEVGSSRRSKQVGKTPALGAHPPSDLQRRRGSAEKKDVLHKGVDGLGDDSPIVVASRGARRGVISSDEDEPPASNPSKGLQKKGKGEEGSEPVEMAAQVKSEQLVAAGRIRKSQEGSGAHDGSKPPGAVNEPGRSVAAGLNVGVVGGHTSPSHPPLMSNPPPHVPSPAFTQYRVPSSKVGGSSPHHSGAAAKKPHFQAHRNESSQKPKSPLQGGDVGGTGGPGAKKISPVLFQPDNLVVPKPKSPQDSPVKSKFPQDGPVKSKSPQDGPVKSKSPQDGTVKSKSPQDGTVKSKSPQDSTVKSKSPQDGTVKPKSYVEAGVVAGKADSKKTSPVPFQPLKVTPPQSISLGTKLDAKPALPKVSPESGGAAVKKVSPGMGPPSSGMKAHDLVGPAATNGPIAAAKVQSLAPGSGAEAGEEEEDEEFSKEPEFKVGHQYRKLLQQFQQLEVRVCMQS